MTKTEVHLKLLDNQKTVFVKLQKHIKDSAFKPGSLKRMNEKDEENLFEFKIGYFHFCCWPDLI